jgi:prepilin-type N-terminal cleavage/methylation domain-containing protein
MRVPSTYAERGLTILEIMIVVALIGALTFFGYSGFRWVTKADLIEDARFVQAILLRANQLAMTTGKIHRLMINVDTGAFQLEVCEGKAAMRRVKEDEPLEEKELADSLERAKERLEGMQRDNQGAQMMAPAQSPEQEMERLAALAGKQIGGKLCKPSTEISGDSEGRPLAGQLKTDKGIKWRELWIQHLEDSATKGIVAIHFFPNGAAEKAVLEVTDGDAVVSLWLHSLTGRTELRDEAARDADDHLMRNAKGDREAER